MTRVFSHPDPAITHLVLNRLEQLGVDAVIQGEANGRGMGEVPPIAAWSEVWVADGASLADVEAAVAEVTAEPEAPPASWTCPTCDEVVGGQFNVCWACGTFAPDAA
jgi:hypothetical protein